MVTWTEYLQHLQAEFTLEYMEHRVNAYLCVANDHALQELGLEAAPHHARFKALIDAALTKYGEELGQRIALLTTYWSIKGMYDLYPALRVKDYNLYSFRCFEARSALIQRLILAASK